MKTSPAKKIVRMRDAIQTTFEILNKLWTVFDGSNKSGKRLRRASLESRIVGSRQATPAAFDGPNAHARFSSFLCRTNFRSPLTVASEGFLRERSLHWDGRQPFAEERTNPSPLGISRLNFIASLQHALSYTTRRSVIRPHTAASDFISQRRNHLVEIKPDPRIEILLSDQRLKKAFTKTRLHSSCRERRAKRCVDRPAQSLSSERSGKASCLGTGGEEKFAHLFRRLVKVLFFGIFRYTFLWISE
ncbi:hypothetical protein NPIL_361661 [Nephila pilipes]|uniref:Uncharacterized protein n=1 Tax=Nephila pilipes TaxID=299642 RepID=A0A8X6U701_NEPPI|nr:hypothetical protein NPIL_361661 [Nephila pilipes]